jgi:putative restriction endonuclease
MVLPNDDPDWRIRFEAFRALDRLVARHGPALPWSAIAEGFDVDGQHLLFANRARGIFWPKQMKAGALSIKTTLPRGSREARYRDSQLGDGVFIYKFQGDDPEGRDNRRLQVAAQLSAPLVYFYAVEVSVYQPIWPVFVQDIDRRKLEYTLSVDDRVLLMKEHSTLMAADAKGTEIRREYVTVQTQRRLHQTRFRQEVLKAYGKRCAVCRLPRPELLDAAHIVPDREEAGVPEVPNGMSLCKLHHGVFDADLMGIRPDGVVELSQSLLRTRDGPTLEHAIKSFQGQPIHLPRHIHDRPAQRFLEQRYERFLRFRQTG